MSQRQDAIQDEAPRADGSALQSLSDVERDLLDFEREWWRFAGAKDTAIRERFGMGAGDYYQALTRLIDRDEALEHDSLLVRRLRRQRVVRQRTRSARRLDRD